MKATALEYRLRYYIHVVIFVLGFVAPWNYWLHLDPPGTHVWGDLALAMGMTHVALVSNALLVAAIMCGLAGAWLRTWGGAYLGADVVQDGGMHTAKARSGIIEAGPFRYVRNPLYLGTFLHTLALSLLMPRTGAIFAIVAIGVVQVRLILAEEPFLEARLGAPYVAYMTLVPRILPSFHPRIAAAPLVARWRQAFLAEIYMWCVALAYLAVGWHYNAFLLTQCVLVALGISILSRAATGRKP